MIRVRRSITWVALVVGCVTLATSVHGKTRRIEMPHYSFAKPTERGWRVKRVPKQNETTTLTRQVSKSTFQIQVMVNIIRFPSLRASTPKEIADAFRGHEESTMIRWGVEPGLYKLEDLVMGETDIGGKTFFTMDYVVKSQDGAQISSLYLCFPRPMGNEYFVITHYSETHPDGPPPAASLREDFEKLLESLQLVR
ncbi:MAG: hypothetical protein GY769_25390 [bacterium]|nr:hypothetical protein [bacterium]